MFILVELTFTRLYNEHTKQVGVGFMPSKMMVVRSFYPHLFMEDR